MSTARRLLDPGDRIGGYLILTELGRGGMAVVYAAQKLGSNEVVAIKSLLPHLSTEPAAASMMLDEARIAAAIDHPNVVRVTDVGQQDGVPFVVMEYLRGVSLHELVKALRPEGLPVSVGCMILAEVARGLHAAHETVGSDGQLMGVVHRDVSPQNVHIGHDGRVVVLDFGIAAARGRLVETRSDEIKGKLRYMAPEQINKSEDVDRRADVWALAVMSFQLFTGRPLFAASDQSKTLWNVLHEPIPRLRDLRPDLPSQLTTAIDASLSRKRSERPPTCAAVAEMIGNVAVQENISKVHVRELVQRVFPERRIEEEGALRQWLTTPPIENVPKENGPAESVALETGSRAKSRPTRAPWLALAALVIASGAGAVGIWQTQAAEPPDQEIQQPAPLVESAPMEQPAEILTETETEVAVHAVELEIDRRVREVRVDGETFEGRPVQLTLSQGGSASVELIAADTRRTFVVGPGDDGRRLRLPRQRANDRPPRATGTEAPTMMGTGSPLLSGDEVF